MGNAANREKRTTKREREREYQKKADAGSYNQSASIDGPPDGPLDRCGAVLTKLHASELSTKAALTHR
jgi:hypothetical protein